MKNHFLLSLLLFAYASVIQAQNYEFGDEIIADSLFTKAIHLEESDSIERAYEYYTAFKVLNGDKLKKYPAAWVKVYFNILRTVTITDNCKKRRKNKMPKSQLTVTRPLRKSARMEPEEPSDQDPTINPPEKNN